MMKMNACRADFGVAEVKPVQLKAVLNQHFLTILAGNLELRTSIERRESSAYSSSQVSKT
jgi:hypothetical protein